MTLIEQPWKCNACGHARDKDANHWWLVIPIFERATVAPVGVQLMPWNDAVARKIAGAAHCCGIACALKAIGQQADVIRLGQQRTNL